MIFIQKSDTENLPHHFDAASALYGSFDCGKLKYKLITVDGLSTISPMVIKSNLFVGSVEFMTEVFKKINISLSDIKLPRNSNRDSQILTLREVRNRVKSGERFFIKPLSVNLKSFTGFVIDEMIYTSIANISNDTYIRVYEPFKSPINSEWRVYVFNHKIADIRNYSGDLFNIPSEKYIHSIIEENKKDFPDTYVIDVGILENETNVVIEFNDMWAIGNYGISNDMYYRMLRQRYNDIIEK